MKVLLAVITAVFLSACTSEGTDEEIAAMCIKLSKSSPHYGRFCGGLANINVAVSVDPRRVRIITAKVDEVVTILNHQFDTDFLSPDIKFDAYGSAAGFVIPADGWSVVHLNPIRAREEIMTTMIVPHEVAHWMVHKLYDDVESHGPEWKEMMEILGVDAIEVLKLGGDK